MGDHTIGNRPRGSHNPDAPGFGAGPGGFRAPGVHIDIAHPHARTIHHRAPAAKHVLWSDPPKAGGKKIGAGKKTYSDLLAEGAGKIATVPFGHALKEGMSWKYDVRRWEAVAFTAPGAAAEDAERVLALRPGQSPAEAILAIFNTPSQPQAWLWRFDCAQFVQLVQLYAVIHLLGPEAFDARVKATKVASGRFMLRQHASPGLSFEHDFEARKRDVEKLSENAFLQKKQQQEQQFKAAPIGSQIVFTNLDPKANGTAFENENTIKMGDDSFIAHGIVPGMPFVTRGQIYDVLIARAAGQLSQAEESKYERRNLYISHVELFGDR